MATAESRTAHVADGSRPKPLLELENVEMAFPITEGLLWQKQIGAVRAVDSINLDILPGETLGLVGESGCGKTTLGRTIVRLYEPTGGKICFDGKDITKLRESALRPLRRDLQMIYQNPYASLNPRMRVGDIIAEPMMVHGIGNRASRWKKVLELLSLVGLSSEHATRYPHEFSGGQRQRIGIARALSLEPRLIVCDEAVSALDVSVQAQILNLLSSLREQFNLTLLFISHDLGVVRHICNRVAVMYLGRIVELADTETIFNDPVHPYTQALLSAVPVPNPEAELTRARVVLKGDIPSPSNIPSGCSFHTRCPMRQDDCDSTLQPLIEVAPAHAAACMYWREAEETQKARNPAPVDVDVD